MSRAPWVGLGVLAAGSAMAGPAPGDDCGDREVVCQVSGKGLRCSTPFAGEERSVLPLVGTWVGKGKAVKLVGDEGAVFRLSWPPRSLARRIHDEEDEVIDVTVAPCDDKELLAVLPACQGKWCSTYAEDIDGSRFHDAVCFDGKGVWGVYRWDRYDEDDVTVLAATPKGGPLPFARLVTPGKPFSFEVERCLYPEDDD